MNLSYRGIKFNHENPNIEVVDSGEVHFRGHVARMHAPKNAPAHRVAQGLKYRGHEVR